MYYFIISKTAVCYETWSFNCFVKKKTIDKMKAFILPHFTSIFNYNFFYTSFSKCFIQLHSSPIHQKWISEGPKNIINKIYLLILPFWTICTHHLSSQTCDTNNIQGICQLGKLDFNWWTETWMYPAFLLDAIFEWYLCHNLSNKMNLKFVQHWI